MSEDTNFTLLKEDLKTKGVKFYYSDDAVCVIHADCREY